jgi:hypothetical protein
MPESMMLKRERELREQAAAAVAPDPTKPMRGGARDGRADAMLATVKGQFAAARGMATAAGRDAGAPREGAMNVAPTEIDDGGGEV